MPATLLALYHDSRQDEPMSRDQDRVCDFARSYTEAWCSQRISGFEECTFRDDGLVAESQGHYDRAEYDRRLRHGAAEPQ